jgi:DUF4097 and DUF4098 domain-containing protein YvlB
VSPGLLLALLLAEGSALATAPAPRGVLVRLETTSGDVEVVRHAEQKVVVEVDGGDAGAVRLVPRDKNTLEVTFDGGLNLRSGQVRLRVPAGSALDVRSQSGDLKVKDLGGEARLHSLSGDISVTGAVGADLHTVSGDVRVEGQGNMRVKTVSGDLDVRELRAASPTRIELESTSGDVRWAGACAAGCRFTAGSVSGDVVLSLDAKSSFRFTFQSHSGDLQDGLGLQVTRGAGRRHGADVEARFGKGEGSIDVRSFSGDAALSKR